MGETGRRGGEGSAAFWKVAGPIAVAALVTSIAVPALKRAVWTDPPMVDVEARQRVEEAIRRLDDVKATLERFDRHLGEINFTLNALLNSMKSPLPRLSSAGPAPGPTAEVRDAHAP
jgi:hypothetical protein